MISLMLPGAAIVNAMIGLNVTEGSTNHAAQPTPSKVRTCFGNARFALSRAGIQVPKPTARCDGAADGKASTMSVHTVVNLRHRR